MTSIQTVTSIPIAVLLFGAALLIHAGYWMLLLWGVQRARRRAPGPAANGERGPSEALPPLSVVVAARNEEADLPILLDALAHQTHPCFEVIIVDDASTDRTPALVEEWITTHADSERFDARLVTLTDPEPPRKKHALTCGIQAAQYQFLAFTDADCAPPPGWLEALARSHAHPSSSPAPLLIGYSPQRRRPGLLNRLARYETFVTGVLTAGACGLGRPYMAVGRNMSYTRGLFERIGGFAHSQASMSGDDDLLVQHVQRTGAAAVRHVFGPETLVWTDAPASWRAWIRQKRRHASAGRFYRPSVQAHLTVFQTSGLLLWIAPPVLGGVGLGLLASKLALQAGVLWSATRVFGEKDLLPGVPLWDLLLAAHQLLIVPLGLARLPKRW